MSFRPIIVLVALALGTYAYWRYAPRGTSVRTKQVVTAGMVGVAVAYLVWVVVGR